MLWGNVEDPWNDQPETPGYNQGTGAVVGSNPAPPPPPATTATTTTTGATEGGDAGGGNRNAGPAFTPSGLPGGMPARRVPMFTAPKFTAPNPADLLNAPGYQFRVQQGQQGIERSAAARGLLRTGGTLRDISEYNQNFASNEYANEFNRAYQTFGTRYQGAKDEYAPLLAEWTTLTNADLQRALAAYGRDTIWYNPKGGGGGGTTYVIGDPPKRPGQDGE